MFWHRSLGNGQDIWPVENMQVKPSSSFPEQIGEGNWGNELTQDNNNNNDRLTAFDPGQPG